MNPKLMSSPDRKMVEWTPKMLAQLKREYSEAAADKQETFMFNGNELVTGYAKYLIEYLDGEFKRRNKINN